MRGMYFAVWAPHVQCVSLVGDFNHWDGRLCPMNRMAHCDIYDIFLPGVEEGTGYQYEVKTTEGKIWRVADPYGVARESGKISKMLNVKSFPWEDSDWMEKRRRADQRNTPMVIYNILNREPEEIEAVPVDVFTHVLISKKGGRDILGYRVYSDGGDFLYPRLAGRTRMISGEWCRMPIGKASGCCWKFLWSPFHVKNQR